MQMLTALKAALEADSTVAATAVGGIHILDVSQNSMRPNVMLFTVSGSDEWTHQGADGLYQDLVRIYSRGDTVTETAAMASAVKAVLNGLITAAYHSVDIKLTQKVNETGDYQDGAKVFRQIDDYRVHYRLT